MAGVSNCTEAALVGEFDRLANQWETAQRQLLFCELPNLSFTFEMTGIVPAENARILASLQEHSIGLEVDVSQDDASVSNKKKILVVKAGFESADELTRKLDSSGFTTTATHDGFSGMMLVREFKPDAVVMDASLPELDGLVVLEQLKSDPRYASIPVVVTSSNEIERSEASLRGADSFLLEPYSVDTLVAILVSFFGEQPEKSIKVTRPKVSRCQA